MWPRWCPVYRWRELVAGAGTEQENLSPDRDGRGFWPREGEPQAADTVSARVPMRGTGADRLVVAVRAL